MQEHVCIYYLVKWEILLRLHDHIKVFVEGYPLQREEKNLRLPEDPGLCDAMRGLLITFPDYMVTRVEALDFILEGFVPSFIQPLAGLDIKVYWP